MNTETVFIFTLLVKFSIAIRDFSNCHEDFTLSPADGLLKRNTFPWLAFIQYIHVTTGLPHHSKAPRVILVQKQFVVGTATDLLRLPKNYKLGNVVFGEYDREELQCGLSENQIRLGAKCPGAYLEMPIQKIIAHPEYTRFGVGNSLALVLLLRPLQSSYMVPVCLPSLTERMKKKYNRAVFMLDYRSNVPSDFDSERMGKKTLRFYTHKECRRHRMKSKLGSEGVTHVLCSSGCGIRPGAPIISQNSYGGFELIGVAAGGGPCIKRTMRQRLIKEPPLYIDVYPYSSWIINVVTAHVLPQSFPQTYRLITRTTDDESPNKEFLRTKKEVRQGWRAKMYVCGNDCFKAKLRLQRDSPLFYTETFAVNADIGARLQVQMQLFAGPHVKIVCAQIILPNRYTVPEIRGINFHNISIKFKTDRFPFTFYYTLGVHGHNASKNEADKWVEHYYGDKRTKHSGKKIATKN